MYGYSRFEVQQCCPINQISTWDEMLGVQPGHLGCHKMLLLGLLPWSHDPVPSVSSPLWVTSSSISSHLFKGSTIVQIPGNLLTHWLVFFLGLQHLTFPQTLSSALNFNWYNAIYVSLSFFISLLSLLPSQLSLCCFHTSLFFWGLNPISYLLFCFPLVNLWPFIN